MNTNLPNTLPSLQKLPRIQTIYFRTLRLPLENKLAHQLPRRAAILDPPARVARRHEEAPDTRFPNQGPATALDRWEVAGLSC
jgi:hypothetical protein